MLGAVEIDHRLRQHLLEQFEVRLKEGGWVYHVVKMGGVYHVVKVGGVYHVVKVGGVYQVVKVGGVFHVDTGFSPPGSVCTVVMA